MYKLFLEKKCSCARKDESLDEKLSKTFEDKHLAEFEALRLINHMNANYCKKHRFYATEDGDTITINMELSCPKEI